MNKTKIEWCDYTWNPVIGCKRGCSYCYARKMNDRFHFISKWDEPELIIDRLKNPRMPKKPSRIFVGSMSDICYWHDFWVLDVLKIINEYPQHTFIFLTKDSLAYDRHKFPSNCWLGVSDIGDGNPTKTFYTYQDNKFVSFEPLLSRPEHTFRFYVNHGIKWVIVGGLTPMNKHKKEWVDEIITWCRAALIPIFLKPNLHYPEKIQEFPK